MRLFVVALFNNKPEICEYSFVSNKYKLQPEIQGYDNGLYNTNCSNGGGMKF